MNRYRFFVCLLCAAVLVISSESVEAEQAAEYYKAGDVGAFSASFEIPTDIAVDTTVFTTRASNEKIYLLYVQSPQSVAERLTQVMRPSRRPKLTPEQQRKIDDLNQQIQELSRKRDELRRKERESRQRLSQAHQDKAKALKSLDAEPDMDEDSALIEEAEARIKELELEYGKIQFEIVELDEGFRVLSKKNREIWLEARKPTKVEPKPEAARSLKVFGRFQGSSKVRLSVLGRASAELLAKPSIIASVNLELPSEDGGNAALLKQWATAQAKEYIIRVLDSPHSSYYQYCLLQSMEKYGVSDSLFGRIFQDRRGRRGRRPDLYAMTTGALAIQESLQLEEMTGRRDIPSEHNVPVSTLKGPDIKSHPFDKMLQGRTPKVFPVAALVPYDNYYCHFTSISKEIAASDLIEQWGTSLLRSLTVTARDSDLPSRYTDQVCIDISELTRLFGDFVIGEIAITGGDPFLREGTDLALIIQVKSRQVFDAMMKSYAKRVLKANPDAKVSKSGYEGVSISSILTPDRRISSHSAYLGSYKVYSNSMDTLRLIIDTYAKRRKSMAENLDFQYMRTIFPGTAKAEDGFIYMSDSFIRKLLSARWKIEAQRRIICQNHLRMIANAGTMYRTEIRKKPLLKTLIEQKYLSKKATQCPDGGTYSLDESGRAFCTVHNCLQYCTPVSSVALEQVAKVEAEDYKAFVGRYNDFWSRFFDPIGIRLKLGNRIEAETCILPLIENSIYNQLREIIGGEPVQLNSRILTDHTIASITTKLRLDSSALKDIREMRGRFFRMRPTVEECVGDNLSLNFYDSDVLFTFADEGMRMFRMRLEEQIIIGLIASSINLPIYAVVDLKDEEQTKIFIREMLKVLQRQSAAEGWSEFSQFAIEPYSAGQYKDWEVNTVTFRFFVVKFRLHYAIASGRLIVSTKRYVLEKALDSLTKKRAGGGVDTAANVQLNVRPRAFDKLRPIVRMGWQERMRNACLKNLEPVRVLVECHNATEQTLNEISKKVEGVSLRCPSGGLYRYDSERDIVYCSVHGNHNHQRQPVEVRENEGLLKFIGRMTDFSVKLQFTEEGIMTKVAFDLERAKW
ncbi:MAG: coiled-coil domain-containing protein [Planctomycetota bacterium]